MGLDTYASNSKDEICLTEEQERAFSEADITLCGGMFSGSGGSFRGKIYIGLIYDVTGVGLFEDWIPPETVKKMYEKFVERDQNELEKLAEKHNRFPGVIVDLQKFFKVCAEHNLGLINWW